MVANETAAIHGKAQQSTTFIEYTLYFAFISRDVKRYCNKVRNINEMKVEQKQLQKTELSEFSVAKRKMMQRASLFSGVKTVEWYFSIQSSWNFCSFSEFS